MSRYYIFPIGDWSSDGHACVAEYLIKGERPLQEVRETHMANEWLGDLCGEYQENTFYSDTFDSLDHQVVVNQFLKDLVKKHELECTYDSEYPGEPYEITMTHDSLIEVWVFALNLLNPELKLTIESPAMSKYYIKYKGLPVDKSLIEGDINFYGYDDKNRHLRTPGYGVWIDHDGEFYLDCN